MRILQEWKWGSLPGETCRMLEVSRYNEKTKAKFLQENWKTKYLSNEIYTQRYFYLLGKLHGILQARILELVVIPFSRESSQPRDWTQGSHIAGRFFTSWATREAQEYGVGSLSLLQLIFPTSELNQGLLADGFFTNWAIREVP